jgi:hypothetical protein
MPGFLTIDAHELVALGRNMEEVSALTHRGLMWALTRAANQRIELLNAFAPSQVRDDERHPVKLKDSFRVMGQGTDERYITTDAPWKFTWVTQGTAPHLILPRYKRALWWPGLEHPVAYVNHPGTSPNPFNERVEQMVDDATIADQLIDGMARGIVYGVANFLPGLEGA